MPAGCRLDAGWMPAGCRLDAGWMPAPTPEIEKKESGDVLKRFNQYPLLISPPLVASLAFTKGSVLQGFFGALDQDPLLISIRG